MRALCSYLDAALYWVISDTYRSQLHEKKWTFLWVTPHFHHRPIETTTLRKWAWFGWRKCCLWALVDAWGTYYCYDDHSIYNCVLVCFGYRNEHSFIKISTQCWCWLVTILKYFDEGLLVGFRWNSVCWHISEKYFKSRNAMPKITTVFYLCAYVHWINATRSFLSSTSIFSYFIPVFLKLQ